MPSTHDRENAQGVIGIILLLIGILILFGCLCTDTGFLHELEAEVVAVPASPIDPANEGKLVHVTGFLDSTEVLTDPDYQVSCRALQLERVVRYHEEGKSSHPSTSRVWKVRQGQLGEFDLSPEFINAFVLGALPTELLTADTPAKFQLTPDDWFFLGKDYRQPRNGDMFMRYQVVKATTASVVARQVKNRLVPIRKPAWALVQAGPHSAEDMFQKARADLALALGIGFAFSAVCLTLGGWLLWTGLAASRRLSAQERAAGDKLPLG